MTNLVVVFDLDQTIGYFTQIGILIDSIETITKRKLKLNEFFKLLDMFPLIFRKGIMKTFELLKLKKKDDNKVKVVIYTNNMGPKTWVHNIRKYIEQKLDYKLFNKTIAAWKVGNKQYEKKRTSHNKRYDDLLNCCNLKKRDKIIFFDDFIHNHMMNNQITYIHNKPYKYDYKFENMVNKIFSSKLNVPLKILSKKALLEEIEKYKYKCNFDKKVFKENEFITPIKLFLKENKKNNSKKIKKGKNKKQNKTQKNNN